MDFVLIYFKYPHHNKDPNHLFFYFSALIKEHESKSYHLFMKEFEIISFNLIEPLKSLLIMIMKSHFITIFMNFLYLLFKKDNILVHF